MSKFARVLDFLRVADCPPYCCYPEFVNVQNVLDCLQEAFSELTALLQDWWQDYQFLIMSKFETWGVREKTPLERHDTTDDSSTQPKEAKDTEKNVTDETKREIGKQVAKGNEPGSERVETETNLTLLVEIASVMIPLGSLLLRLYG